MKIIGKLLLILIITLAGAAITCGGNLILDNIKQSSGEYASRYANDLFLFWAVEIGAIFICSVWFLFFKKKKADNNRDKIMEV